ncbi:hypothetical protein HHI36_023578 [Cryptolaemus montrouzieri]|uniref:Uncharacterized protein n=1 Tax=Cryptolaemus montrouzieri TaxID=559131 RepID=A0ABD2PGZ9_9CUCU
MFVTRVLRLISSFLILSRKLTPSIDLSIARCDLEFVGVCAGESHCLKTVCEDWHNTCLKRFPFEIWDFSRFQHMTQSSKCSPT